MCGFVWYYNTLAYVGNPVDVIKKLHDTKQWDEIVSFCQKMLAEDQKDLIAIQNMATAFLNLGKFEDVLSCCDKVFEQNPLDEYAIKNKVFALEMLGRHAEILEFCDKILAKDSLNTWLLNSKGLALNELGEHEDAIQCYDTTIQVDQNNVTALLNKAITLSYLQKYSDAIQFYDRAQQQEKLPRAASGKSTAYQKLGKEDEAFLAAQGLLDSDIERIILEARSKKMKIFDYYCLTEYNDLEKREQAHKEKMDSKLKWFLAIPIHNENIVQNQDSGMGKSISCKDAGKSCGWSATAASEDELLQITLEHVKEHHKELTINLELSKNIKSIMKDTK